LLAAIKPGQPVLNVPLLFLIILREKIVGISLQNKIIDGN